jgi:hypothetical protein
VFTARYAPSPYIKQIRFVFKGLTEITLRWTVLNTAGRKSTVSSPQPLFIVHSIHQLSPSAMREAMRHDKKTSQTKRLITKYCSWVLAILFLVQGSHASRSFLRNSRKIFRYIAPYTKPTRFPSKAFPAHNSQILLISRQWKSVTNKT